jgi:hypothetical protein
MLFLNLLKKMDEVEYILNKAKLKLFVYFLKKKKVFNSFIANFNSEDGQWFRGGQVIDQNFETYVFLNSFDRLINNAFSWERTKEGFTYYSQLNDELKTYYRNLIRMEIFNDIRKIKEWERIIKALGE